MKKVLVAGAALLIAGSANAGVNISGDARVTYVGTKNYSADKVGADGSIEKARTDGYNDYFESRVGLNFEGKNERGAGAKARLYFDDAGFEDAAKWDGTAGSTAGSTTTPGVTVDYAYLTAPLGEHWTVKAGRLNPDFSKFFSWNIRATRLAATYDHSGMKLTPFVGVKKEEAGSAVDQWDDNDYMECGLVTSFTLPHDWILKTFARYNDDQREKDDVPAVNGIAMPPKDHTDRSGFDGSIHIESGKDSIIGFEAEVAYKAADFQGKSDDGMGGYVLLAKKVSPKFTPAVVAGMTKNGYVADNDFGFVMVGGNDFTQVMKVGDGVEDDGSLLFGAFVANVAVSSDFTLAGNFMYADFDNSAAGSLDCAFEVSGVATYALSNGASLTYKLGYLSPSNNGGADVNEDPYVGQLLRLNVAF